MALKMQLTLVYSFHTNSAVCHVAQASNSVMSAVVTEGERLPQRIHVIVKQSRNQWKGAVYEDVPSGKLERGAR